MPFRRIAITGGAGFVGAALAQRFVESSQGAQVVCLDNLSRRGSDLNVSRLVNRGVKFVRGDVRCAMDLEQLGDFDLLVDCAADASVQAGLHTSPWEVIDSNLVGTARCLDLARRAGAAVLFLSTSRVYPISRLNELPYETLPTRYRWRVDAVETGLSDAGVSEEFPLDGVRSFYGASKLAGELLAREYAAFHRIHVLIDRCALLAGPGQMAKSDQGVVALWAARHHFQRPLSYIGFDGHGRQVRDVLHIDDFANLIERQLSDSAKWDGRAYNVGGGPENSVSLVELTRMCAKATGHSLEIGSVPETSPVDIRIYISDARKVRDDFGWRPRIGVEETVNSICRWLRDDERSLRDVFAE